MMKIIELKDVEETVHINGKAEPHHFKTDDLIRSAVNFVPPGGFVAADMMNRLRIMEALDKAKDGKLQLEDSDFDNLRAYVKVTGWTVVSRSIAEFIRLFD